MFQKVFALLCILVFQILIGTGCEKRKGSSGPVNDERTIKSVQTPWFEKPSFSTRRDEIKTLKSLLVQQDGKLIVEYYRQSQKDELQDIRSVTKSVLCLLVGIAKEQGHIESCDDDLDVYLASPIEYAKNVEAKVSITHLLSMKDGFNFDESRHLGELFHHQSEASFLLSKRVVNEPGSQFNYSSASSNLLSWTLALATETPTESYARSELFQPLGIEKFSWDKGKDGVVTGGYGLNLRARDLIKIGELLRHDGMAGKKQVVSPQWLEQVTAARTFRSKKWGAISELSYGQLWWTGVVNGERVIFALGHGGQYVMVVPELKLTIVTTATYTAGRLDADQAEQEISRLIAFIISEPQATLQN